MGKSDTHSLWIRPFGDTAFHLQQMIKRLGEKYDSPVFEPHVTLLGGLKQGQTELIQLTDTLASSLRPFQIMLERAGYRDQFYRSLFIHARETEALLNARKKAERLFDFNSDEKYMPHLSLMYSDFPQNQKERILNTLGREFHIEFEARSLLLVNTEGKPRDWKKIHSAEFSAS